MRAVIAFCLIAICLASNDTLLNKVLNKTNELKNVVANNTKTLLEKAKHEAETLHHKIHHNENTESTLFKVHHAGHVAANKTVATAKAVLNKTTTWVKSILANHHLNAEEKQTLAQKIVEKSKALLNKAKTDAANLKNKIHHNENTESTLYKVHEAAHVAANKTVATAKAALNKTTTWIKSVIANHHLNAEEKQTLAQKIVEKSKALLNKAKTDAANLKHKIHNVNEESVLAHKIHQGFHHAVNHTKSAANTTVATAKAALNKTSSWIKSVIANHHLNAEEKTLAQKLAEKSQALLNKAKTDAANLKHKIQHSENTEVALHKAHQVAQKAKEVTHKAVDATKNAFNSIWSKFSGF